MPDDAKDVAPSPGSFSPLLTIVPLFVKLFIVPPLRYKPFSPLMIPLLIKFCIVPPSVLIPFSPLMVPLFVKVSILALELIHMPLLY